METAKPPFQFTLRTLLLATAAAAIVFAFFKVVGGLNAVVAIWWAMVIATFIWAWSCWICRDMRGQRIRFLFVASATVFAVAATGLFCVYYRQIDVAKVDSLGSLFSAPKVVASETIAFEDWCFGGGFAGAVLGAIWSLRTEPRAVAGATMDEPEDGGPGRGPG